MRGKERERGRTWIFWILRIREKKGELFWKRRREREKKNVGKEERWICEWKTLEN